MKEPVAILLAEDETLVRQGLKLMIESAPELRVAAEAADGSEALGHWERRAFDLIVMDIRMPRMDGLQAARRILARDPAQKILILTTFNDEDKALEALRLGVGGYLLKTADTDQLLAAIRSCLDGGLPLEDQVAARILPRLLGRRGASAAAAGGLGERDGAGREGAEAEAAELLAALTERERSVVRLVGAGRSNREIAEELGISQGTVKNVVSTVLDKLGLRDRTQLAIHAIRHDLV